MKNNVLIFFIGIIIVLFIGISWYIGGLNKIVRFDESVNQAWSEIENQLLRRNDLIPNLVNSVKGITKHEDKVFTYIADARAKLAGLIKEGGSLNAKIDAAKDLQSALGRLLVIVENYPQLKANQNFLKLQDELSGTENRIAVARTRYNRGVQVFNTFIREVFGGFFARKKNLNEQKPYFEIDETVKKVPVVKF